MLRWNKSTPTPLQTKLGVGVLFFRLSKFREPGFGYTPPFGAYFAILCCTCASCWLANASLDAEVVVQNKDDGGEEEEEAEKGGDESNGDSKMREDMELILAALVDFRRDMKALNKKVQQITDNDGHKNLHTLTKHNPGFLE